MNPVPFHDRFEAGRILAAHLAHYENVQDGIVMALPRGGVPVGFEVACRLYLPLDIFLVRKLGVPGHEELAMGAIATGGVRVLNDEVIQQLRISDEVIESVAREEELELLRRELRYRGDSPPPKMEGRRIILIDDGLATGASMRAAVQALHRHNSKSITVAVPVAAASTRDEIASLVDEMVCARTPEHFEAVGRWYKHFDQLTDEQVTELLHRAAHQHAARDANRHLAHS